MRIVRAQIESKLFTYKTQEILEEKMLVLIEEGLDEDKARAKVLEQFPDLEEEGVANFWIQPMPISKTAITMDGIDPAETAKRRFIHCIDKWDLEDDEGKPLPCTDEIKGEIFDYGLVPLSMSEFLRMKINQRNDEVSKIPKN